MSHISPANAPSRTLFIIFLSLLATIFAITSIAPSSFAQEIQPIPVAPTTPATPGAPASPEVITPPPASSVDRNALSSLIRQKLPKRATNNRFGEGLGATFAEMDGPLIYSVRGDTPLMPASTIKLFTAAFALRALGPDLRLPTKVVLLGRSEADPSFAQVSLIGSGDPLLSSANLRQLAKDTHNALAAQGITQVEVFFDDGLFPAPKPAPGWRSSYGLSTVAPVRALNRDRRNVHDSSKDAAQFFTKRLRNLGTAAKLGGRQIGTDMNAAIELANYQGHTVSHAVRLMSVLSDNDIAENLFRLVAINRGYPPTWEGARAAATAEAAALGIDTKGLRFTDGSGLSRDNRLTANSLVQLLQYSLSGPDQVLRGLADDTYLATAGRSGTLRARYTDTKLKCSRGEVYGKTGSLRDVSSLAGVAKGVDGHPRVFAVLVNGAKVQGAPRTVGKNIDTLATTLVGCQN